MPGIYRASPTAVPSCLEQGELLSGLDQVRLALVAVGDPSPAVETIRHPLAIILSQACDLEQDFGSRFPTPIPSKQIPSVLFCEVSLANDLRGSDGMNGTIWNTVKKNSHERYQFLERVEPSCEAKAEGLGELGIDFKRYFTLPTEEVYKRIELGLVSRRFVLISPYLEHLSSRFAYYMGRVGLVRGHASE